MLALAAATYCSVPFQAGTATAKITPTAVSIRQRQHPYANGSIYTPTAVSIRQRRFTPKPRVATAHPGYRRQPPSRYPNGVQQTLSGGSAKHVEPRRGTTCVGRDVSQRALSRRWALVCNPVGVFRKTHWFECEIKQVRLCPRFQLANPIGIARCLSNAIRHRQNAHAIKKTYPNNTMPTPTTASIPRRQYAYANGVKHQNPGSR